MADKNTIELRLPDASQLPPPRSDAGQSKKISRGVLIFTPIFAGVLVAVIVLGFAQGNQTTDAKDSQAQTQQTADAYKAKADQGQTLADGISAVCSNGGVLRDQLLKQYPQACQQAEVVKQQPVPGPQGQQGQQGEPGKAGRGITGTAITAGHLFVTYTDGATEDKGQVVGAQGLKGDQGRGITGTAISAGHLILNYSDNTSTDVGQVVGKDGATGATGATGPQGPAGRGIASVGVTTDFQLVVTYTDGTTTNVGPLPAGPQGPKGDQGSIGPQGVSQVDQYFERNDSGTCQSVAVFSDGHTERHTAGDSACPIVSPSSSSTTPTTTP